MHIRLVETSFATLLASCMAAPALAGGITVHDKDEKFVKMGGRIQLQYHYKKQNDGDGKDDIFFRRLRPYIEGSLHKGWKGKFQFDFGKASGDNEVAVKDAYMQYKGFDNVKVTIGNANFPFSREFITSSKYQQLVERTFVGDHNYGTPDRNMGLHISGNNGSKTVSWAASLAQAAIDPDKNKLDFDTPANKAADFNQGWMVGGRMDFHPFGPLKFAQGDFKGDAKATMGIAAYAWNNNKDNNSYTSAGASSNTDKPDINSVRGFEVSGAFRLGGLSIDAEDNLFLVDTVDSAFTGGLYRNGGTSLKNWALEGGYMVLPTKLEVVAGYQSQDADNYQSTWIRKSLGVNWFVHKHDIKMQLSYRMGSNLKGVSGSDEDELFLQTQYVF